MLTLTPSRHSAEAAEDGEGDSGSAGHGDAGTATGRQPGPPLLPALLHLRRARSGALRAAG